MVFLSTYWWAFGIGAGVFMAVAVFFQLLNLRRLGEACNMESLSSGDLGDSPLTDWLSRLKGVVICGVFAISFGVLTVIGVIVALIGYFRTSV